MKRTSLMNQCAKPLSKSPLLKRSPLKKRGPRATLWDALREKKLVRDRDAEGLIECQDWKIGLPRCGRRVASPDLHHAKGRDGKLLLDEEHLVWLVREPCHGLAHDNNSTKSSPKTPNDQPRPLGNKQTPSRTEVSRLQGQPVSVGARPTGRTVYSSVQNRYAPVVVRKKEGGV